MSIIHFGAGDYAHSRYGVRGAFLPDGYSPYAAHGTNYVHCEVTPSISFLFTSEQIKDIHFNNRRNPDLTGKVTFHVALNGTPTKIGEPATPRDIDLITQTTWAVVADTTGMKEHDWTVTDEVRGCKGAAL